MAFRTIEQLANVIGRASSTLSTGLADRGHPSPTVADCDSSRFKDIDPIATKELVDAARELECLVQGPAQMLSVLAFAASCLRNRINNPD